MAQKPIGFYGKFTPTSIDNTVGDRFKALAGLSSEVGQLAVGIGKAKAADEAPAQAETAIEESRQVADDGTITYAPVKSRSSFSWGSSQYNNTLKAGYSAAIQNDLTGIIKESAKNNPVDYSKFISEVTAAKKGLTGNLPIETKYAVDAFYQRAVNSYGAPIQKEQNSRALKAAEANLQEASTNVKAEQDALASEGNLEELQKSFLEQDQQTLLAINAGLNIDPVAYKKDQAKRKVDVGIGISVGIFQRARETRSEAGGTPSEIVKEGEAYIRDISKKTRMYVADPSDSSKTILLNEDEKSAAIKTLTEDLKSYKDNQIRIATEVRIADELTQIENYTIAMDMVEDPSITPEAKEQAIAQARKDGDIGTEDARILKAYVTSTEKLNASVNADFFGDIITQIYDLNASISYDPDNAAPYLIGINNIRSDIMQLRADGNMSVGDEKKLTKQIATLTAAKIAGATQTIFDDFMDSADTISMQLPPELQGKAKRDVFYAVELIKEQAEASGTDFTEDLFPDLYNIETEKVITRIKNKQRNNAIKTVKSITTAASQTQQPVQPPVITTQAQYDALQSGDEYLANGTRARKP